MNRTTLIWAIVIIIIIALGAWYFSSNSSMNGSMASSTAETSTGNTPGGTSGGTASNSNSFHSIFSQSGSHQCIYQQVDASTQTKSTVDIANGKMYGEFRTTGETTSAQKMLYTGGVLYVWNEGATTGKKSNISSLAELPQAIPGDLTSAAVYGVTSDSVSWDCHNWITDASLFVVPSYVTFSSR